MKKKVILFAVVIFSFISTQATTIENIKTTDVVYATCSGEFKINGDSYTITLHDVSWWTCVKFKVGSWFN